ASHQHLEQPREVRDEIGDCILASRRPVAVAVAAKVRNVDAVVRDELRCELIPNMGVIAAPVDKQHGRISFVTPDEIMQAQPGGLVEARLWLMEHRLSLSI